MRSIVNRALKAGFLRRSAVAIGLKFLGIVASYVFTLTVTNFYGAEAWGEFSLAFVVLNVLSILSVFGLGTAMLRNTAQYATSGLRPIARLYWQASGFVAALSVPLQLAMCFFSDQIALLVFKNAAMGEPIRIMSFALLPISMLNLNTQVVRGQGKDVLFMLFTHVLRFLIPTVIVLLAAFLTDNRYVVHAFVIGIHVLWLWSFMVNLRDLRKGDEPTDRIPGFRALLALGFPLLLANSSVFMKSWVDTFMIGVYMQPDDVGVYNVALKASLLVNLPLTAINAILAKNIASLHHKGDLAGLERFVKRSTAVIIGLSYPLGIGLLLLRGPLLGMFGEEFDGGMTVLVLLVIGSLINVSAGSVGLILEMTGGQRSYRNILVSAFLLSVLLNVILIPRYGILGAGLSTVLTSLYWNGMGVLAVKRNVGFVPFPTQLKTLF